MNQYLLQLTKLIGKAGIESDANLVIIANDGQPAVVQVRRGFTLQIYVENEDQSKLELVAERTV